MRLFQTQYKTVISCTTLLLSLIASPVQAMPMETTHSYDTDSSSASGSGYATGNNSNDDYTNSKRITLAGFDSTLGKLTGVTLSYSIQGYGELSAGTYKQYGSTELNAYAKYESLLNYGFDNAGYKELDKLNNESSFSCTGNYFGSTSSGKHGGHSGSSKYLSWSDSYASNGYYCSGLTSEDTEYVSKTVDFDMKYFDDFTKAKDFNLELVAKTYDSYLTCTYNSDCGMNAKADAHIKDIKLTYKYDKHQYIKPVAVSVPAPETLLLMAIGLAGIGYSRKRTTEK